MRIGQTIQCQSCGASDVIKHKEKSMLECQYCGAMMAYSEQLNQNTVDNPQNKPAKLAFMLIMIPILVIVLMVIFWVVFQNIRKQTVVDTYPAVNTELTAKKTTETNHQSTVIESQVLSADSINELLTVQSQVSGTTSNGGQYWIFGLKNTGDQRIIKPGVMLSLFNQDGKRIEEQGGWSMREVLEAGEETTVLVYVSAVPTDGMKQEISTFASQSSYLSLNQVEIKVEDYQVSMKNNQFEVIGDVMNDLDFDIRYVRLMAVAYNNEGEPIGIGNAFSTVKDLAPKQVSGFKIRVGTFLTDQPVSWQVYALARKQ